MSNMHGGKLTKDSCFLKCAKLDLGIQSKIRSKSIFRPTGDFTKKVLTATCALKGIVKWEIFFFVKSWAIVPRGTQQPCASRPGCQDTMTND